PGNHRAHKLDGLLVWLSSQLSFPIALEVIAAVTIPVLLIAIAICIRIPTWEEAKTAEPGGRPRSENADPDAAASVGLSQIGGVSTDQLADNPGAGMDLTVIPGDKAEKKMLRSHACIKSASSADGSDVSTYPNVPLSLTSRAARTSPPIAAR